MRVFTIVMVIVTLPITIPVAVIGWAMLNLAWNNTHLPTRVVAEERSDDAAIAATVTAVLHPGWWLSPSCDVYSVHVSSRDDQQVPPDAWDLDLPFDRDELCEGPVSVQWAERRRMLITVATDTLEGAVTHKYPGLIIQIDYRPRAQVTAPAR